MKKLSIAVFFCVFAFTTLAQTRLWVGGSVSFGASESGETNFGIFPEFGYRLSKSASLGLMLGYSYQKSELSVGEVERVSNGFVVNPFLRYAFFQGRAGALFVDGSTRYALYVSKLKGTGHYAYETSSTIFDAGIRPGISINVSDRVAITSRVGFLGYSCERYGPGDYDEKFVCDFGMDYIDIGFYVRF